jgi:ABC-type phosphate transport system substrate-binding protein
VALAFATLLLPCFAQAADSVPFKLIVNPSTAGARIPKAVVASIFLCQVTSWGDGSPIKVLDRSLTSPLRVSFGNEVLGMTTLEMSQYWRRQMAKGKLPPASEESDAAVLEFVAANPGAIAYVAADTPTPSTLKVVEID